MPVFFPNQDAYPYAAAVFIQVTWSDGTFSRGSGALVGRNDILTAAHVVYSPYKAATDIDIFPAFDGGPGPYGKFDYGYWRTDYVPIAIDPSGLIAVRDAASDLAVIGVSSELGAATGWFGLASYDPAGTHTVLGYPGEQGTRLTGDTGYLGVGFFGEFDFNGLYIRPGSSGGPVLNGANQVVGVVSTGSWAARIDTEWPLIQSWIANNDSLLVNVPRFFAVYDTATGETRTVTAAAYAGPVAGLNCQLLGSARDEVVIGTNANDFINTLGGIDAVDAGAGDDVIDGGTQSNFLTGGTGREVFFLDGRGGGTTWSTITDWQNGEQLSIWGFRPGVSRSFWATDGGAAGYRGLTLHADLNGDGQTDTSVTWTGIGSVSQLPQAREFDGLLWFT